MKSNLWRTVSVALSLAIVATAVWAFPTSDPNSREVNLLKRLGKAEAAARPPDKGLIAKEGALKEGDLMLAAKTIDKLIEADYVKHKIQPNARANNDVFLRRAYLDLTGRIPTLDETIAFRKAKSADKRQKLVDHLLESEGYVQNFFNFYADLLRIQSRQSNSGDVVTYPYIKFVKQSLRENMPYDKFVQRLITAEGYTWEDGASGYWLRDLNMPLDGMSNTAQVFLGTRLVCAQCHDHPFDVWSQHEFYEMAAFTYGLDTRVRGNKYGSAAAVDKAKKMLKPDTDERRALDRMVRVLYYGNMDTGRKIKLPSNYKYKDAKPGSQVAPYTIFGDEVKPGTDSLERRKAFATWLTAKSNPRFAKTMANRLWKRVMGMGLIEPVDDMKEDTKASNPELMAYLTQLFKDLDYDQKKFLKILVSTNLYNRQVTRTELPEAEPYYFQGPLLRRMTAEQLWDSLVTLMIPDPDNRPGYSAGEDARTELAKKLQSMSAEELVANAKKMAGGDRMMGMMSADMKKMMNDPKWKGLSGDLVRASELQSPMRPTHWLRLFGQSDRDVIDNANMDPNVVQVLAMFNGQMYRRVAYDNTELVKQLKKFNSSGDQAKILFMAILNRMPSSAEASFASGQIKKYGYESVIWALLNTRQFSFIQ